jgi:HK97 family phage major capsid protein
VGAQQLPQAQPDRQGGRKDQPGVGHEPPVVKLHIDFVGVIRSHLTGVLLPASNGCLASAILAGQRAPVAVSGRRTQSVTSGSGLRKLWEERQDVLAKTQGRAKELEDNNIKPNANDDLFFDQMERKLGELDGKISKALDENEREQRSEEAFAKYGRVMTASMVDRELDQEFRSVILERLNRPIYVESEKRSGYQPGLEMRSMLESNTGFTPSTFHNQLMMNLVESSAILRAGASVITTQTGETLLHPRGTADSSASIVAEGSPIGVSEPTVSSAALGAFKYAFLVQVSYELAQDQNYDLLGYIARESAGSAIP